MSANALRAALAVLCVCACSGQPSASVMLTVVPAEGVDVEQLNTRVETAGGEAWGPVLSPEKPAGALQGTQTLRLLLPAVLEGKEVRVKVDGLTSGKVRAKGESSVLIEGPSEAAITVALLQVIEAAPDGGQDAGVAIDDAGNPTPDAGEPVGVDAGSDAGAMPPLDGGMRDAGMGVDGGMVEPCGGCSEFISDGCSMAGQCTCGTSMACGSGQRCVNGQCVCNAAACNGCCAGNTCRPGDQPVACGAKGTTCEACSLDVADTCVNGACRCGAQAACATGQRCQNGACVCNAVSCPNGCCAGGVCRAADFANCGAAGTACSACDMRVANMCSGAGVCQCGANPACGPRQRCSNGVCVCDKNSCPDGCCQAGVCLSGDSDLACGRDGKGCGVCMADKHCNGKMCKKN